jgi:FixJ family two-component response regulator
MEYQTRSKLIAVVDDDDLIRNSIADLLMSAGYESHTFASAEEFLASDEMHETACLVTDIRDVRDDWIGVTAETRYGSMLDANHLHHCA